MRKLLLMLAAAFQLIGCISANGQKLKIQDMSGIYRRQGGREKLELKPDGLYILYNPETSFTPIIEQCDYASNGKWSLVADNLIEITSENYYTKQMGFEYKVKKENKFSQDSLYLKIVFPADFHTVKLNFTFNNNNNKSITTSETYIVLPKSKYLWNRRTNTNQINFSMNADVSGTTLYQSRILFKIFEDTFNTEKYNYLSIYLPNFDRCFFEFKPYYQELIYRRDKNQITWHGDIWIKDK